MESEQIIITRKAHERLSTLCVLPFYPAVEILSSDQTGRTIISNLPINYQCSSIFPSDRILSHGLEST